MMIQTQCKKCGVSISIDFGNLSKDEALAAAEQMDNAPRECPGRHVELSGVARLWQLEEAIHRAYDLGEGQESKPVLSDKEYLESLLAEGREIIDGGCNTVPESNLPSLHDFKDLVHMGFGDFKSDTHLFLRCDSPRGTRFYEKSPQTASVS